MPRFRYLDPRTCFPDVDSAARRLFAAGLLAIASGLSSGCGQGEPGVDPNPANSSTTQTASPAEPAEAPREMLPPPADQRFQLGRQLLVSGRFAEAEVVFEALQSDGPRHPSVAFLHAISVQKQKKYAAALAELDELASLSVDYPERRGLQHFRGWCLFYLGRPGEAAEAFAAHLAVQPDEPDSHFGLGVSRLELGETEAALTSFDRAIEIDLGRDDRRRDLAKAWIRRGDALWELDRIEEATASFHKGVIQFPDHYEGWAKLARGHERLGDADKVEWATREERNARTRVGAPIDGDLVEPDA
jgi:tetratricopeptide (TPR) repeat protein